MTQEGFQFNVTQRASAPVISESSSKDQVKGESTPARLESHYWVSTFPFFSHTVLIIPPPPADQEGGAVDEGFSAQLTIYDADGMLGNRVVITREKREIVAVELDPLMGGCKIESGLKHGHLLIESPAGFTHLCRIRGPHGSALVSQGTPVTRDLASFMPLTFSADRSQLLSVINTSNEAAQFRCRLYCGKRTPEMTADVPAHGVRLLSVQSEFSEFAIVEGGKRISAYARFTSGSNEPLLVQLVERYELMEDSYRYAAVS